MADPYKPKAGSAALSFEAVNRIGRIKRKEDFPEWYLSRMAKKEQEPTPVPTEVPEPEPTPDPMREGLKRKLRNPNRADPIISK